MIFHIFRNALHKNSQGHSTMSSNLKGLVMQLPFLKFSGTHSAIRTIVKLKSAIFSQFEKNGFWVTLHVADCTLQHLGSKLQSYF